MIRNPVMFTVEIGTLVMAIVTANTMISQSLLRNVPPCCISLLWCWELLLNNLSMR
ncbi:MAG: hypothetical protein ABIO23_14055 [Chitinophagales bacterium]